MGLSATGVCICENSPNVHLTFMPFILFKFCFKRGKKKTVMHITGVFSLHEDLTDGWVCDKASVAKG